MKHLVNKVKKSLYHKQTNYSECLVLSTYVIMVVMIVMVWWFAITQVCQGCVNSKLHSFTNTGVVDDLRGKKGISKLVKEIAISLSIHSPPHTPTHTPIS